MVVLGQGCEGLVQAIAPVAAKLRQPHPCYPLQAGSLRGRLGDLVTQQQQMNVALQGLGSPDQLGRADRQRALRLLRNDQYAHGSTFASCLSLSISSSTEPTLAPPLRTGGAMTPNCRF